MSISERIYRLLLRLYPRQHRRHYGEPMITHFRDQLREAHRDGTLLTLWLRTLIDVATTAPREHVESARMRNVYPWPEVLLAILPGVLPLLLPPQADRIERLVLLGLAATYLVVLGVYRKRNRPTAWVLPVLGLAGTYAVLWGFFLLLGEWRWFGENLPYPLIYLLPAAVVVLTKLIHHGNRPALVLFGTLLLTSPGLLLWQGAGSRAAYTAALEAPALILLAAALGLPFAGRYGLLGALFVAGSAQWAIEFTIDPSLQIRFGTWPHLLSLLNTVTTLVIIPLLALRAQSGRGRTLAILLPLATCLLFLVVLPPLVYTASPYTAGHVDIAAVLEEAVRNTIYAAQILAGMAFVLSLYSRSRQGNVAVTSQLGHQP